MGIKGLTMFQRIEGANGVVFFRSTVLGFAPHGFSTRIGGVSGGIFESLNLGNPSGVLERDSAENIAENYRLMLEAIGCPERKLSRVHQAHGTRVVRMDRESRIDEEKADGILTEDIRVAASVRVADCAPVLIATRDGRRVAAAHAGWRGTVAGVVSEAVSMMGGECVAAIRPCIGMEAFEVGGEVLEAFEKKWGNRAPIRRREDGKGHVDLKESLRMELVEAGVKEIDVFEGCTFEQSRDFFSHRREKGITGRMAAVIGVCGK
jgi:polyphenol oxidase